MKRKKGFDFWVIASFAILALYLLFMVYPLFKIMGKSVIDPKTGTFTLNNFIKFFSQPYYSSTQAPWLALMENGTMESATDKTLPPLSWMLQKEWTAMLEESSPCHEKHLHLAAIHMAQRNLRDADEHLTKALSYAVTPIALFLKAQIHRMSGDLTAAADTALEAYALLPSDVSLCRQALALALRAGKHDAIVTAYETAPAHVQADGRVAMTYAFALLRTGKIAEAETVLWRDGGLSVTDIREGEISLTSLYMEIEKAKAAADGTALDDADIEVPRRFDFRMFVPKKK